MSLDINSCRISGSLPHNDKTSTWRCHVTHN